MKFTGSYVRTSYSAFEILISSFLSCAVQLICSVCSFVFANLAIYSFHVQFFSELPSLCVRLLTILFRSLECKSLCLPVSLCARYKIFHHNFALPQYENRYHYPHWYLFIVSWKCYSELSPIPCTPLATRFSSAIDPITLHSLPPQTGLCWKSIISGMKCSFSHGTSEQLLQSTLLAQITLKWKEMVK